MIKDSTKYLLTTFKGRFTEKIFLNFESIEKGKKLFHLYMVDKNNEAQKYLYTKLYMGFGEVENKYLLTFDKDFLVNMENIRKNAKENDVFSEKYVNKHL